MKYRLDDERFDLNVNSPSKHLTALFLRIRNNNRKAFHMGSVVREIRERRLCETFSGLVEAYGKPREKSQVRLQCVSVKPYFQSS